MHRGIGARFRAVDLDARIERARGGRDAGDQAAAADRDHQHVERRHRLQHFQADGALAGHDQLVLVGMHEHQVVALGERPGMRPGLGERFAFEHHRRAVHLGVLDLGIR